MRLGKPIEHLQAALRAAQSPSELGEQLATIGRQLAYFGYLTYDAIVWVSTFPYTDRRVPTRAPHLAGKYSKSHQPQAFHSSQSHCHLKPVLAVRNFTEHYTWSAQGQNRLWHTRDLHSIHGCRPAALPNRPRSYVPPIPGVRKILVTWHSARRDSLLSKSV